MKETLPKHVHIIGICGVATGALAIAFHNAGVKVTGSDKGFYPPISTTLLDAGIDFYAGWHVDKMTASGDPDLVIIGTATGNTNPETEYVRKQEIPAYSFAEAIGKFFVRKNSIVSVGTWGKTTTSALLSWVLKEAGMNPSYMTGGIPLTHTAAQLSDSAWSVLEGDEYKSAPWDNTPKFAYYNPTHLLLTAVSWDHADLYKTEKEYFDVFEKIAVHAGTSHPIIACTDDTGVRNVLKKTNVPHISYGRSPEADYTFVNIGSDAEGIHFDIVHGTETQHIRSPLLGSYNAQNITGVFTLARSIGIDADTIADAIHSFQGIRRRLEKYSTKPVTIISDIAHSPEKARTTLSILKEITRNKIIVIFEPNIGGRSIESVHKYEHAFTDADYVFIPRLSKLKVAKDKKELDGLALSEVIHKTHPHVAYIDDDSELVAAIKAKADKGDCIAFLGSHGFRGMIETIVDACKDK